MLRTLKRIRNKEIILLFFVLLFLIIFSSFLSDRFLTWLNVEHLLIQSVGVGIASFALCCVILTGGIDLSIGMIITFGECIASYVFVESIPLGVPLILAVGIGAGFLNGRGITKLRLSPFIMTFCMMLILEGLSLFLRPVPGGTIPVEFYYILMGNVGPVPKPFILLIGCFLLTWIILTKTTIGTYIYAVGGNENAAILSGINVDRIKTFAYCFSGFLGGMGALFYSAQTLTGDPNLGMPITLDGITAVALGGVPLIGGKGNVIGVLIGVLIVTIISNILNLAAISTFYQYVIKGIMLLIGIGITMRV